MYLYDVNDVIHYYNLRKFLKRVNNITSLHSIFSSDAM